MTTRILVLNGPNLGSLGTREPGIYGHGTLADLHQQLQADARDFAAGASPHTDAARTVMGAAGVGSASSENAAAQVELRQTDAEGEMIGWLHEAARETTPVILNAGAWTHYSYALHDAVAHVTSSGVPVIEVHLSNPHARDEFRHTSVISGVCTGTIAGFGFDSYRLALVHLLRA